MCIRDSSSSAYLVHTQMVKVAPNSYSFLPFYSSQKVIEKWVEKPKMRERVHKKNNIFTESLRREFEDERKRKVSLWICFNKVMLLLTFNFSGKPVY